MENVEGWMILVGDNLVDYGSDFLFVNDLNSVVFDDIDGKFLNCIMMYYVCYVSCYNLKYIVYFVGFDVLIIYIIFID